MRRLAPFAAAGVILSMSIATASAVESGSGATITNTSATGITMPEHKPDFSKLKPIEIFQKLNQKRMELNDKKPPLGKNRAIFEIKWGTLKNDYRNCFREVLVSSDSLPTDEAIKDNCKKHEFAAAGSVSVSSGALKLIKPVKFESNDTVEETDTSSIAFESKVYGHHDGFLFEHIPAEDAMDEKPVLTVSLNGKTYMYEEKEDFGRQSLDENHSLSLNFKFEGLAKRVENKLLEKVVGERERIQDKIDTLDKKFLQLKAKKFVRDSKLDGLKNLKAEIENYNFVDAAGDQMRLDIDNFVDNLPSDVTEFDFEKKLENFRGRVSDAKKKAKALKFAQGIIPFKDTDDSDWFTNYVDFAKERGVIGGYKDEKGNALGEFRPSNNVTVAEMLKMVIEASNAGELEGDPNLADAMNHWARGYVKRAETLGLDIIESNLKLNRYATRGEVVRAMLEVLEIKPDAALETSFTDLDPNHKHAAFIEFASKAGIISGDDGAGTVRPDDQINRAEVAKIIQLMIELFVE